MKFVRTVIVFDQGDLLESRQWVKLHKGYVKALRAVVHPPGNERFIIRKKARKPLPSGAPSNQWTRNGVVPIKDQFLKHLKAQGWLAEQPVVLEQGLHNTDLSFKEFPGKRSLRLDDQDWREVFHDKVGDFDFFSELPGGVRCVIEWETGNISSTHRSMNKLCLSMLAGLIDIGVVILPSRLLYAHLTDRIGNWMEISPYLPLWQSIGKSMKRGLLAITVVEHDQLTDNPEVPYLNQGIDGRSAEGAAKLK